MTTHDNADYDKASNDTLREQVAEIVADLATGDGEAPGPPMVEDYAVAEAVIPMVLGVVADEIKALRMPSEHRLNRQEVLAVVERLRDG